MAREIMTSLHGRRFGLTRRGELLRRTEQGYTIVNGQLVKRVTSAQVLALNASPVTIIAVPNSANEVYLVRYWTVYKPAGTAYAGIAAGEDLVLKYTDGSGAQAAAAIEATGFLDQATAQFRAAGGLGGAISATPADITPVVGGRLVLQMLTGEITTGTSDLIVAVHYDIVFNDFTVA